jgi:hypothetical protein
MDTDCVLWEVGTGFLCIIYKNFSRRQGRAIVQAVSRRPLTAQKRVQSQASQCTVYGGQSVTGTGSEYFSFSISLSFHQISILIFILILLLSEGQAGEAWELSKAMLFFISESSGQESISEFCVGLQRWATVSTINAARLSVKMPNPLTEASNQ